MSRGAHREGTPVPQVLAELRHERGEDLPGIPLSGKISDRVRALNNAGAGIDHAPERGTEKAPPLSPGSFLGIPLTGRRARKE